MFTGLIIQDQPLNVKEHYMSKIQQELAAATEVTKKRGQDEQEYMKALVKATSDLADADWNKLSVEAQDWFNEAADAVNQKNPIAGFPDAEPPAEDKPSRRRAAKEEPKEEPADPVDPEVGDIVKIVTKRNKTIEGKVIEIDEEVVVVESDGEELEVARDRIDTITVAEPPEEKSKTRSRKAADEEPEDPVVAEPKEGDSITAVSARDKEYSGEVIEIGDDLIVIKDAQGEELELTPSKLKSLVIHAAEVKSGRRKAADDSDDAGDPKPRSKKEEPAGSGKPKRTSTKDNGGVSATGRMRELILDDMDAKVEDIAKLLNKEGIQYRPNTLSLVFADVHKLLSLMKAKKIIK